MQFNFGDAKQKRGVCIYNSETGVEKYINNKAGELFVRV